MKLTQDKFNILAHVVIDPQDWFDTAEANPKVDEKAVLKTKVDRWRSEYKDEKAKPGYKTRAVKQAESDVQEKQERVDRLAAAEQRRQEGEQALNIKIATEVAKQLAK